MWVYLAKAACIIRLSYSFPNKIARVFVGLLKASSLIHKILELGRPGWLSGLAPPSAQGLILETLDPVPCRAPSLEHASPSASLFVSLMNK